MPTLQEELDALEAEIMAALPPNLQSVRSASTTSLLERAARLKPMAVGEQAPSFTLPDADGVATSLDSLLSHGPVLLHFYRGHWCSFCQRELDAFTRLAAQFHTLGVRLVFVSPDSPDRSAEFRRAHDPGFVFLADLGAKVAGAYGVQIELGQPSRQFYESVGLGPSPCDGRPAWALPTPSSFLIVPGGEIRLSHHETDHRQRLDPAELLVKVRAALGLAAPG
ncbi:MAG: AhpC/TSA family protein [Burkholderiales bacterium]|nr:AhpC/TSA family protein [Burkholderiales bacterium]